MVLVSIFVISYIKTRKHIYNIIYVCIIMFSYDFEALHHWRAVKSPTMVIFEDPKHIDSQVWKSQRHCDIYNDLVPLLLTWFNFNITMDK